MSSQQEGICPICMEQMDLTDKELQPCICGYKICLWCWHFIIQTAEKDGSDARCPACRSPYDKEKILEKKISKERLAMVNANKPQMPQKTKQRVPDVGKDPYNIRVIKRNIVYIAGLPKNLSDEKILRKKEYLGQYGKIIKIFFAQTDGSRQYYSSDSCIVYVTFSKEGEAFRCIQVVNGYLLNGRPLKASFGTTRYCHSFLKNLPCKNSNCSYVHDVVPQEDICEREDVIPFCTSKLQQCPGLTFSDDLKQHSGSFLPPPLETKNSLPPLGLIKNNRCMESDYFQRSYSSVAASDNQSKSPSMNLALLMTSCRTEVHNPVNAWDQHISNEVPTPRNEMPVPKHDVEIFTHAKPFDPTDCSKIANTKVVGEDSTCRMYFPDEHLSEKITELSFFSDSDGYSQLSTSPANVTIHASACNFISTTDKWRCEAGKSNTNGFSSECDDLFSGSRNSNPFLSLQALSGDSTSTHQNVLPSCDWSRSQLDLRSENFSYSFEDERLSIHNIRANAFSNFPAITTDLYHKNKMPSAILSTESILFHGEQKSFCSRSSSYNGLGFQSDETRGDKLWNDSYMEQCKDGIFSGILGLDLDAIDYLGDTNALMELGTSDDSSRISNSWIPSSGDGSKSYFATMDDFSAASRRFPSSGSAICLNKKSSCPKIMTRKEAYTEDSVSCSSSRATQRSNLSTPPGFPPIKTNQGIASQSQQHNSLSSENTFVNRCQHPYLFPNSGIEENLPAASQHLAYSSNHRASQYWNAIAEGVVGEHRARLTGISSAVPELQHEQQHQSHF